MRKNLLLAALLLCSSLASFAQDQARDTGLNAKREMMKEVLHDQSLVQMTPAARYKEMENVVFGGAKDGWRVTMADLQMLQKAYLGVVQKTKAKKPQRSIGVEHNVWCATKVEMRGADGELTRMEEHEYDKQGNLLSTIRYLYENKKPVPESKFEQTYDAQGNVAFFAYYMWDKSKSQWIGDYKWVQEFDSNNVIVNQEEYLYDEATSQWFLSAYYYVNYDIYGWLLSRTRKSGRTSIDGAYTDGDKVEYGYDKSGVPYLSLQMYYKLNAKTDEFEPCEKWEWKYDQDARKQLLEASYWMGADKQWKGNSYKTWGYDDAGRLVREQSLSGWTDTYNTWASGELTENGYDGNELTKTASYEWVPRKERFDLVSLRQQEFTEDGRLALSAFVSSYKDSEGINIATGNKSVCTYTEKGYEERMYTWNSDNQEWLASEICMGKYGDNGKVGIREFYSPELVFLGSNTYIWQIISYTDVYPDIYMRGTFNSWTAPEEYKMTDKGNGIVEIENVALTENDEFKFADSEWGQLNWGSNWTTSEESYVYSNEQKRLTYNGGNLRLPQGSGEVICKKITLDIVNGLLLMVYADATAVNLVATEGSTILVEGNKIVTKGARQVEVCQADGKLVSRAPITSVGPGLYVVKADNKVIKVQVK